MTGYQETTRCDVKENTHFLGSLSCRQRLQDASDPGTWENQSYRRRDQCSTCGLTGSIGEKTTGSSGEGCGLKDKGDEGQVGGMRYDRCVALLGLS